MALAFELRKYVEAAPNSTLGVVFTRARIPEVGDDAVAEVLGDQPGVDLYPMVADTVVQVEDVAEVLRLEKL
jgi:hypothetical protein